MEDKSTINQELNVKDTLLKRRVDEEEHSGSAPQSAEEVIQGYERTFRMMAEQSLIGVSVVQDGVFKYVNSKFAEIHGYGVDELLHEFPFQDLVHPDYRQPAEELLKEHLPGDVLERRSDMVKVSKNGQRIYVENYDFRGSFQGKPAIFGFTLDATVRKLAEKDLRESEERYRSLASVADRSYVVDNNCRYLFANDSYLSLYNLRADSLIGRKYDEFHDEKRSREFAEAIKYVFDTGNVYQAEFRGRRNALYFIKKFSPVRNSDGSISAVTVISIDITGHKRMEEELERHRQHLEAMVKERTEELESKNIVLQELNVALKVLLTKREEDKKDLEERFVMNIQNLVIPYVEQLKESHLNARQQSHLDIMAAHLHEIATPLLKNMSQFSLTPKETKVATLVRQGKSTKEIEKILGMAMASVSVHRKNIRKKLALDNRAVNLTSYLESLSQ